MLSNEERALIKSGTPHKDAKRYRSGVAINAVERYSGWAGDTLSGFDVYTADFSNGGIYEWKGFYPLDHVQNNVTCKTVMDAEHMWAKKAVEEKKLFVSINRTLWD